MHNGADLRVGRRCSATTILDHADLHPCVGRPGLKSMVRDLHPLGESNPLNSAQRWRDSLPNDSAHQFIIGANVARFEASTQVRGSESPGSRIVGSPRCTLLENCPEPGRYPRERGAVVQSPRGRSLSREVVSCLGPSGIWNRHSRAMKIVRTSLDVASKLKLVAAL